MAMQEFVSKEYGFSFEYPAKWVSDPVDLTPIDMSGNPDAEGVSQQIRIASIHPTDISDEDMEKEYEEILIMKQVLTQPKTLEKFTEQLQMDMAKTYVQLRQLGIDESHLRDEITIRDSKIGHLDAKCAVLPLFLPMPHPEGYMVVLKRPTYQKWCMLDDGTSSFVMMYMSADVKFVKNVENIKKMFETFTWAPPSFPEQGLRESISIHRSIDQPPPAARAHAGYSWLEDEAADATKSAGSSSTPSLSSSSESVSTPTKKREVVLSKEEEVFLSADDSGVALIQDDDSDSDDNDFTPSIEEIVVAPSSPAQAPAQAPASPPAPQPAKAQEETVEEVQQSAQVSAPTAPAPATAPVAYRIDEPSQNGAFPDITIAFSVPEGTTKHDLEIDLHTNSIRAGIRGQPPIIEGTLLGEVLDDALWHREGTLVTIPLQKKWPEKWGHVVAGPRVSNDKTTIDCTSLNLLGRSHADKGEYKVAFQLFKASAEKNQLNAMLLVADVLSGGTSTRCKPYRKDVAVDHETAVRLWSRAASAPHSSSEAMYSLGRAYMFGNGVQQSATEALNWLDQAIKHEHVKSLYLGGIIRFHGGIPTKVVEDGKLRDVVVEGADTTTKHDRRKGLMLIRRAATLNLLDANIAIGHVYFEGGLPGVESVGPRGDVNFMEAEKYYSKAKQLNGAAQWEGPPQKFLEEQKSKLNLSRQVSDPSAGAASGSSSFAEAAADQSSSVAATLSNYAPHIAVGALIVAFAVDWYRKSKS